MDIHRWHAHDKWLQVKEGDLVLMDIGCELHGYVSDLTRTWPPCGKFSAAQVFYLFPQVYWSISNNVRIFSKLLVLPSSNINLFHACLCEHESFSWIDSRCYRSLSWPRFFWMSDVVVFGIRSYPLLCLDLLGWMYLRKSFMSLYYLQTRNA